MHSNFTVQGHAIEVVRLASAQPQAGRPCLIFLHEGLGSVAMWRDFPQQVADATGCAAVVYSRYGYGQSAPITAKRNSRYMHDEALLALPQLIEQLEELAVERPILIGHSDGASIALIYASEAAAKLSGVVVMAPHVFVEEKCIASIAEAKLVYDDPQTLLRQRLAKFHADVDSAFRGWNDIWLDAEFRDWNIVSCLSSITCPILAIQGEDDEYGTMQQLDEIAAAAPRVHTLKLPQCKHSPHKDQNATVIAAINSFVGELSA